MEIRDFFSHSYGIKFIPFGTLHIFLIILTIIPVLYIYFFQNKLKKSPSKFNMPKIFALLLLFNQLIFYIGYLLSGHFDLARDLPLHYCYITGYLYIYMLWFNKKNMYNWLYYSVFMCTLASIIWMDIGNSYDRFIFYKFFIAHSGLFIINIYCFYILEYPVSKKGALYAWFYSNGVFILMAIYNFIFNTNYIMSKKLPTLIYDIYPWIKKIDQPIIWLEVVGIIILLIAYIPVYYKKR